MALLVLLAEFFQQKEVHQVFFAITCPLAGNNVAQVRHGESVQKNRPFPGLLKARDAVRGMYYVQIKR